MIRYDSRRKTIKNAAAHSCIAHGAGKRNSERNCMMHVARCALRWPGSTGRWRFGSGGKTCTEADEDWRYAMLLPYRTGIVPDCLGINDFLHDGTTQLCAGGQMDAL